MIQRRLRAFTILELVIVVIIVGVLATIALARFFRLIETSRGTEALTFLRNIRFAEERCRIMSSSNNSCECTIGNAVGTNLDWNLLALDDPAASPNSHFSYNVSSCGAINYYYTICAYRNTVDGGVVMNNYICLSSSDTIGVKIAGNGVFSSIQQ